MNVQVIGNQNFEAKKFRVPVRSLDLTNPELIQYGRSIKKVNMIKEYSNPKAEFLYKQAQKSNNIKEKMRLYAEMGNYELYEFEDGFLGNIRMKLFLAISKIADLLI